jgi:hypothetical protein
MKRLGPYLFPVALALAACPQPKAPPRQRAEIRKISASTVQIIPAEGQLPYCLAFTISAKGVIRQLTMNRENRSVECRANAPIGGVSYRFPINEGRVRIFILFSDQKLEAGPVAEQIVEKSAEPTVSVTDLRLPGRANAEVLEFLPAPESEPMVGTVVGRDGRASDASPPSGADAGK